jgi:hypothetical protein
VSGGSAIPGRPSLLLSKKRLTDQGENRRNQQPDQQTGSRADDRAADSTVTEIP